MATDNVNQPSEVLEWKPMSQVVKRRIDKCFEHAAQRSAQPKCDFDYVHSLLAECVTRDPGNIDFVEAMLNNLKRKYKNNKKGARLGGFGGGKGPLKKAVAKKDWKEVFKLGVDALKTNPWDAVTLRALAEASEAYRFNEIELRYLKTALEGNVKNIEVSRHCAKSLARMGNFDQAIVCWHRVEELHHNDPEAGPEIANLTIRKSKLQGGKAESPTISGLLDEEPKEEAAAGRREIRLTPRQQLERAVADDPTDLSSLVDLAELLLEEGRFGEAEQHVGRGITLTDPGETAYVTLQKLQVRCLEEQLADAEKLAAREKTSDAVERVKQLKAGLASIEIDAIKKRLETDPDSAPLKYQLGLQLKRAGQFDAATEQLQRIAAEADDYAPATLELGECRQQLKQYRDAFNCYLTAASAATDGQADCKKRALYRGGLLAAGLKDTKTAAKLLTQLLEIDSGYKDAKARLDKIQKIGDKG